MNNEYTVSTAAEEPGKFLPTSTFEIHLEIDVSPKISDQIFEENSSKLMNFEVTLSPSFLSTFRTQIPTPITKTTKNKQIAI